MYFCPADLLWGCPLFAPPRHCHRQRDPPAPTQPQLKQRRMPWWAIFCLEMKTKKQTMLYEWLWKKSNEIEETKKTLGWSKIKKAAAEIRMVVSLYLLSWYAPIAFKRSTIFLLISYSSPYPSSGACHSGEASCSCAECRCRTWPSSPRPPSRCSWPPSWGSPGPTPRCHQSYPPSQHLYRTGSSRHSLAKRKIVGFWMDFPAKL